MQEYRLSAAAEQSLLSAIVQNTLRPSETGLLPSHFESAEHQAIFKAALDLEQKKQPIDLVTMVEATGLDDELVNICAGGMGFSIDLALKHAQIIRDNALKREISRVLVDTSAALSKPDAPVSSVCLTACDQLKEIIAGSTAVTTRSMLELVLGELDARENPQQLPQRVTTGMDLLDGMMNGGMIPSNFVVIGARPGVGKSALLLSMALAAGGKGKKVLYISLEMSDEENAQRTLAHISQIAFSRLIKLEPLSDKENIRISEGMAAYGLENIQHYAAAICRVSDIRNLAVRLKDQGGLDMVCVDYIGLLRPEQNLGSRVNEISQITRDLKALAMELGVVVVAAAQLNRDNAKFNRRPVLSDLRESGSIEQDANVVIFVHDDGTPPDEFGGKRMELIIAKNRQGQRGIIRVVFRGNVMRFAEES
ncbi:MAG: hypothetical protein E7321_00160 [Clostridiales bacterium]|nr:hypothetical protein [Clostridiales bacterium]